MRQIITILETIGHNGGPSLENDGPMSFSFEPRSPKLVAIYKNGVFAGWLEKHWKKSPPSVGGGNKGYYYWEANIDGRKIQATTLTKAKQKIEGKADLVTGRRL